MIERSSILISSAGRRVELVGAFKEALGRAVPHGRVHACDVSLLAAAPHFADDTFLVPPCTRPEYIDVLLDECDRRHVGLVIPTIDHELPLLAHSRQIFASRGITVLVPDEAVVALCADKRLTNAFLVRSGLPHVRQLDAGSTPGLLAEFEPPFIAKPAKGSAGQGVVIIKDIQQLAFLPDDYVVEQLAGGHEYTMDVYVDRAGECRAVVPRRRLEIRGGEVSKGVTCRDPRLDVLAREVVGRLQLTACVLTIQAFMNKTTPPRIIEINARFGGGYPLAQAAGARFPEWLVAEHLLGVEFADDHSDDWEDGVLMLRYDQSVFVSGAAVQAVAGSS